MRLVLICLPLLARAGALDADAIMAQVAANQERAESLRSTYVYHQDVMVRVLKSNGTLAREERRAYVVTPTPTGSHHDLIESNSGPAAAREMDRDLADGLVTDLTTDAKSRDGIRSNLFPLTSARQKKYSFKLVGRESYRDKPVYHIQFEPQTTEVPWRGDVYVDVSEMQPVMISSQLAQKIPLLVRTLLGTDVGHLGFKVTYKAFDGQWFPETYSGELKLRALFLYSRRAGIRLENRGFQRSDVSTSLTFPEP